MTYHMCNYHSTECYTKEDGEDYRGVVNKTEQGEFCQKWTSQTPHEHSVTPDKYPNDGLGNHNYCRNPGASIISFTGREPKPWCYTLSTTEWDWCNVGFPSESCQYKM